MSAVFGIFGAVLLLVLAVPVLGLLAAIVTSAYLIASTLADALVWKVRKFFKKGSKS